MPNTFTDNRDAWLRMSDIDYLGQFVKVWLAFNAWYRSASTEHQDRKIINEIKWAPGNVLGSRVRPMLVAATEEAAQLRADVGLLHHRLENYELHEGKGDEKRRITLTQVFLRDNPPALKIGNHWGYDYRVDRVNNGQITTEVRRTKDNWVALNYVQPRHNHLDLEAQPNFLDQVPASVQPRLRQLYMENPPRLILNLLDGAGPAIACGAFSFGCGRDHLFAGVVEAIYLMRCTLFHGELVPTKEAVACYEPAYRLVRRFLDCVT